MCAHKSQLFFGNNIAELIISFTHNGTKVHKFRSFYKSLKNPQIQKNVLNNMSEGGELKNLGENYIG